MAKKPYKIDLAKKEKTISFRIPNEYYNLLKYKTQKTNQSVNIYAREKIIEYFLSIYPELFEEDLTMLNEKKSKLVEELAGLIKKITQLEIDISVNNAKIREWERQVSVYKKREPEIRNRIKELNKMIKQTKEAKGGG